MKTMLIESNSWHLRLARIGGFGIYSGSNADVCGYTRCVLLGSFLLFLWWSLLICLFVAFFGLMLFSLYELVVSFYYSKYLLTYFGEVGLGLIGGAAIFTFLHFVMRDEIKFMDRISGLLDPRKKDKEPGFIKIAYLAWKDKYCFRVKIKY